MSTESVQAMPEDKRLDLAIHCYAMDGETALTLHKLDGILELICGALNGVGINEPMPSGVDGAVWAARGLVDAAMVRGGIKAVQS